MGSAAHFPLVLNNSYPNTVVGSLVGMAPVGGVTATDSLNLLRSTMESNLVVTLAGTITVVTVGVIDWLNVPVSTPRLNLSSVRWTYAVASSIHRSTVELKV